MLEDGLYCMYTVLVHVCCSMSVVTVIILVSFPVYIILDSFLLATHRMVY